MRRSDQAAKEDLDTTLTTSRRHLMGVAAKLALAAPLAVAALQPGIAWADGDDHDDDSQGDEHGRGHKFGLLGRNCSIAGIPSFQGVGSALPLVPVSQVSGGTGGNDFQSGNVGNDPLSAGTVAVNGNHQVLVAVRGAEANTQYDVRFVRLWDNDRSEDPGGFTTDGNGNFSGVLANALTGTNRVGAFVVTRTGGSDEYITVWP